MCGKGSIKMKTYIIYDAKSLKKGDFYVAKTKKLYRPEIYQVIDDSKLNNGIITVKRYIVDFDDKDIAHISPEKTFDTLYDVEHLRNIMIFNSKDKAIAYLLRKSKW